MSREDVRFDSAGIQLAGHLYLPPEKTKGRAPGVVVGHPGSGVKEQVSGLYARRLAERGFVALAFDAAYQGESGGEPRGLEDPAHRVEDLKAAASFLTTRSEVDAERIGGLGICASGAYVLAAAAGDLRIKAIATVSAADVSRQFRLGAEGTQGAAVFQGMLEAAGKARTARAQGAAPAGMTIFPDTIEVARQFGGEHGAEGFEYYRTPRGQHPRAATFFDWTSVDKMVGFDAFAQLSLLGDRPLLMVTGTRAVTSWMSVEAYQRVLGPKEIYWVEGASHVDLDDKAQYVDPAVERLASFFSSHLSLSSNGGER